MKITILLPENFSIFNSIGSSIANVIQMRNFQIHFIKFPFVFLPCEIPISISNKMSIPKFH